MTAGDIALKLIQNVSLLLCFVLLFDYFLKGESRGLSLLRKAVLGLIISGIGYILMLTPWSISPGLFFDTRSILLSVSGLFLGPLPTGIAIAILSVIRYNIGGDGALMGIATIITSGFIGVLWANIFPGLIRGKNKAIKFLVFGFVVHIVFLICTLLLPEEVSKKTFEALLLPVLLLYAPGTMIMCVIMVRRAENWQAKNLLIESQSLYSSLVNHMPAGVFRKRADGTYDFVNERFCELKGLTPEEIIGKNPKELADYEEYKSRSGKYDKSPIQRTLVTQGTDHHEWIMRHGMPIVVDESYVQEDGHIEYFQVVKTPIFNAAGKVIGTQGMQFDITPSKRAQEALAQEQFLLRSYMDNTPDSIFFKNIEGRFTRANRAQLAILGVSDESEAIGKSDFDFFSPHHAKKAFEDEQMIIRTGLPLINREEKASWADGRTMWFNTSKFPLKDKDGNIVGTFGVSTNITSQKNLELDLVAAKLKAEESDRLKTAFLHNISHEIRTPMNAIVGFSGFLNDPDIDFDKKSHFAQVIVQSSNQLMSIIDDIVLIATIEAGQEKVNEVDVDLNSVLYFAYEQFGDKAREKGISFRFIPGLENSLAVIRTDEVKFMQVINNLLVNAFKFTTKGHVYFGYKLRNETLEFFVEDTGIGIVESKHQEIFNRFSQVDSSMSRQYGGSGLGLSISKAYIDLMGGRIWVDSQEGVGSCFYFTIPYKQSTLSLKNISIPEEVNKMEKISSEVTILIAEDEELNFLLIRELLKPFGFKVIHASNGVEAVSAVSENNSVDLVLMDLKMPVMDGFEATKIIKELKPELEVIALTAYSLDSDKKRAIDCGCSDVIVKPIQKDDLYAKLSAYTEKGSQY